MEDGEDGEDDEDGKDGEDEKDEDVKDDEDVEETDRNEIVMKTHPTEEHIRTNAFTPSISRPATGHLWHHHYNQKSATIHLASTLQSSSCS